MFTVKVDVSSAEEILKKHGLGEGGRVQAFFTNEIMRISDPYTPFKDGALKASARMSADKTAIEYHTPYARYHWYGRLMVDPQTGKGAFFSHTYGFWSRPGVQKVLSDRNMTYNGAPLRGPKWVQRCWNDNRDTIIKSTESFARGQGK